MTFGECTPRIDHAEVSMTDRPGEVVQQVERRRHYRASLDASALIHAAAIVMRGRIVDLSLGGVRIRRIDETTPCPAVGSAAMVELELGTRGWIATDGRIVRCALDELVVQFAPLAAQVEDLIEDEVLNALEAAKRPRMIVVDPSAERRRRVSQKLRAAGCESYEAATPLEAIGLLEKPRHHIAGVAVAQHLTQTGGDEMCDFLAETNPGIKLALLQDLVGDDDSLDSSLQHFVESVGGATPPTGTRRL
jgi:CheY-like chemotaxis protein